QRHPIESAEQELRGEVQAHGYGWLMLRRRRAQVRRGLGPRDRGGQEPSPRPFPDQERVEWEVFERPCPERQRRGLPGVLEIRERHRSREPEPCQREPERDERQDPDG